MSVSVSVSVCWFKEVAGFKKVVRVCEVVGTKKATYLAGYRQAGYTRRSG